MRAKTLQDVRQSSSDYAQHPAALRTTAPLENAHPAPVGTASFFRQKREYYLAMPITSLFNTYIFLACILHTSSEIRCRRAQTWTHISMAAHVRR